MTWGDRLARGVGVVALASLGIAGCENMPVKLGEDSAKTVATGSAGGASSENANKQLEHCDRPFGTVAIVEDQQSEWYRYLTQQYHLTSTVPVLRLLIQQSNCFIVVDRGRAMNNMMQERGLMQSGELRAGSNFGKGQMVSADYSITPEVLFSQKGTGGIGGGLGGWVGVVAAVAGSIKTNEAATLLMLTDNRSGVQVAAAEGSAANTDFALGGLLGVGVLGAGLGGYTNTPEGKVVAGAFMDAYNQLVKAVRNYSPQTMGDRGMGTGGRLTVDGASQQGGYQGQKLSLKKAQQKLIGLGYLQGTADGKMGAKTRQAIQDFQRDRGLPVTGVLDGATHAELSKP
ncbi:MAG: peptidoglycan-binding protein [Halothiobacillus sp.]|nr:peptidoglycan-binding protein [Halothiobacillus sp.]